MAIYYLLSGCNKEEGYKGELTNYLKKDLGNKNKIAFIPTSPDDYQKSDKYVNINLDWFKKIDLIFDHHTLIDNRITKEEMKSNIKKAQVIFLMGGNPITQIEFIMKNDLAVDLIRHSGIIIGMSAGSINMAERALCSKDEDIEQTLVYDGIGLVNFNIEPHFDINNKDLLNEELFPLSKTFPIFAITDNSALRVEKNKVTYIGTVYEIKNNQITCINNEELNRLKLVE